jgi:DNA polymerase III epsilon subunit-like protein
MLVAFDTETTGLVDTLAVADDRLPEVIEFYGVLVDEDGSMIREVETLVRPRKKIPAEITRITTITNEDVRDAPAFDLVADEIADLIQSAPMVVAHNIGYDIEVLNLEFKRIGAVLRWPKIRICTIEQTMHFKGHRLSLSDLHEHLFGEKFAGAHRARADVEATVRCVMELKKRGEL